MSFWKALKESILEMIFGRYQLEAWRQERLRREECERFQQEQYEKYKSLL